MEVNQGQSRVALLRTNLIGFHCLVVFLSSNMIGFQIKAKHEGEPEARDREGQVNFEEAVVRRLKGLLSS